MKVCASWLCVISVAVVVFSAGLSVGCGGAAGGGEAQGGEASGERQLTVLAASSLTDAFTELKGTFEEENPGVTVRPSFASSSDLLAQVQQGVPADVFAAAGKKQMDAAVKESLAAGPEIMARNRPVVVVPSDNPAGIQGLEDLGDAGVTLVLAEEGVPIAQYAGEVLAKADAEYGGGFERSVRDRIASREANVRATVNRVVLGDADATFAYISDVTEDIEEKVRVIEIPAELNVVAEYPIAVLSGAAEPELARGWVDLVMSDEGQAVLQRYKFEPVTGG